MEFRILGPLEVVAERTPLRLGGPKQRALLAYLLIHAGETVARDRVIEDLWGDDRPAQVENVLRVLLSRLRAALPGARIVAAGGGYALELDDDELDARRFERLAADGREALQAHDAERAAATLEEALALWRGPALADFAYDEFAQAEVTRLEELRLAAREDRIDACLALGRHADVLAELNELTRAHPLRERPHRQRMLALYRAGRQADALAAYREARRILVGELGVEPGPELAELHAAILRHDPALTPAPARPRLPAFATPIVGRENELGQLRELLAQGTRLLTLTGPGGIGKTRLALHLAADQADRFAGDVHFVGLAPLRDPELVPAEIAAAVGVEDGNGETTDALARELADRRVLIVVDNFEHVDDAAPALGALLRHTRGLRLVVTSRHPLRLYGEHEYAVPPLDLDEAVPLFLARARARARSFDGGDVAAEICRRLDCLPLAIELAAGRADEVSPAQMLEQLSRLDLAAAGPRDVAPRQQTLRAAIDWSYRLLPEDGRILLADLSVFAGGFDEAAIGAVCDADPARAHSLAEMSLVVDEGDRFSLLETIREFAAERLDDLSRTREVRERHARHFLTLAREADEALVSGRDAGGWLDRLEREHDNLRAALDWAVASQDADLELSLGTALGRFWEWRGHVREGLSRLDAALDRASHGDSQLLVRALLRAGVFAHMRGDRAAARGRMERALDVAAQLGDDAMRANALRNLGALAKDDGDYARAQELHERALALSRRNDDRAGISSSLINLADVALARGDDAGAEAIARESVALAQELGHEVRETMSLINLGFATVGRANDESAAAFSRALELCERLAYREGAAVCFVGLAMLATRLGEHAAAGRLLGAADAQLEEAGAILESGERELYERTLAELCDACGSEAVDAARAEGAALTFEEAVREAARLSAPTGAAPAGTTYS